MNDAMRGWLGEQVRTRVVGPDAATRRAELFDSSEPGWFDRGRARSDGSTPMRRCSSAGCGHCSSSRCTLEAMAGVAQHSDYRADPWGRLQRTADFLAATTFGPATRRNVRSASCIASTERVVGVTAMARNTPPTTLTCCDGCTSPNSTASLPHTTDSASSRSWRRTRRVRRELGSHRPGARRARTADHRTRAPRPVGRVSTPSSAARPRPATLPATCSCSRRFRWPAARPTG